MSVDKKIDVTINSKLLTSIQKRSESTYPEECCGFLYGTYVGAVLEINRVQKVNNQKEENRQRRFLITPQQYIQAEELAEELELDLVGVYHSHPDHPAEPSKFDLDHALPGFVYPIISVIEGNVAEIRWWELEADRKKYRELQSQIIAPTNAKLN